MAKPELRSPGQKFGFDELCQGSYINFHLKKRVKGKVDMAEQKKENGEKKAKLKKPTALKRDLQSKKRNLNNHSFKAKVNSAVRSLHETISRKDTAALKTKLSGVYSLMDKGVKKGVFKMNKASRVKSRLHALTKRV
jgi:small subunit ribosomal protein S20